MKSFSKTYALSFFALCVEENLTETVMEDIKTVLEVFTENKEYSSLLDSPVVPLEERLSLIDEAFEVLHEYVRNFIKILCEKKNTYMFTSCAKEFEKLYNKHNNIEKITVVTAVSMDESLIKKLKEKLETKMGKNIILQQKVDPSIIGGIVLRTENSQTDASVRARLEKIRTELSS